MLEEQVRDVVQMNQPVEPGGAEFVLLAQLVTKQPRRLVRVMHQLSVSGRQLGGVMVDDDPVRLVQALLERQVTNPGRFFRQTALAPVVVVVSLQRYVGVEQLSGQAAQQQTRQQPVQIAFVGQNHFRFGQGHHTG